MNKTSKLTTLRDGALESPWETKLDRKKSVVTAPIPKITYDCLIIGAGITGLTAALSLQLSGKKTIIIEAENIGYGTTGGTSAHINTFADTTFNEAGSAFGEDGAKLFANAINEGCRIIQKNIGDFNIDCDYEPKIGYLYAEDGDQIKQLNDVYEGAIKVGVTVTYTDKVPIRVPYKKALQFDDQAQFHPLKYLAGLAGAYLKAGGIILERTRVTDIDSADNLHTAQTASGNIQANTVIYATHVPPKITVFSFRCAPYRSYVLAIKLKSGSYPDGLVYDLQDPYHYFRTHIINGEPLLLVGGNDHKTGHDDPEAAFADLEKYTRKYYNVSSVKYRWSSQYYIPADGLPYVGQIPFTADGIFTATGYNGNGMMLGSVAGKILSDIVQGKSNPYAGLFSPSRIKPIDGFSELVTENADVAWHFIADRFGGQETDSLKRLRPGTGKVVEFEGRKVAAYRDEEGVIHALNPVCTHAKCIVNWNSKEKSWDCPCHGARFDIDGKVLNGPADKDLQQLNDLLAKE